MQPQVHVQATGKVARPRGPGDAGGGGDDPGRDPEEIMKMIRMMLMRGRVGRAPAIGSTNIWAVQFPKALENNKCYIHVDVHIHVYMYMVG